MQLDFVPNIREQLPEAWSAAGVPNEIADDMRYGAGEPVAGPWDLWLLFVAAIARSLVLAASLASRLIGLLAPV